MHKRTIHDIVLEREPSKKFHECFRELKEVLPKVSDCHRLIIASWWCGVYVPSKIMHKIHEFALTQKSA